MLRYEIKKSLLKKSSLIAILTGMILTVLIPLIILFVKEKNQQALIPKELKTQIDDSIIGNYKKEYEELKTNLLTQENGVYGYNAEFGEQKGKYRNSKAEDYELLGNINLIIERIDNREKNKNKVLLDASSNEDYALINYFNKEQTKYICDTTAINRSIKNAFYPLVSCAVTIIIVSGIFAIEKKTGINPVIINTKNGYNSLLGSKIVSGVIMAILVSTLYFGAYLLFVKAAYGMTKYEFSSPLWYADGFEYCKSSISVIQFFTMTYLFTIITAITVAFIAMLLSNYTAKTAIVSLIVILIIVSANVIEIINGKLFFYGYQTGDKNVMSYYSFIKIYKVLKMINPFSLIDGKYYFAEPRYFEIGNMSTELWILPALVSVIVVIGCFGLTIKSNNYPKKVVK